MSDTWLNLRFGNYYLQLGKKFKYFKFFKAPHIPMLGDKWFESY